MAHPRRVAKVAAQIQREISELFITDPVVQAAICQVSSTGFRELALWYVKLCTIICLHMCPCQRETPCTAT